MADNKLNIQIITPQGKVLDEMVDSIIMRTTMGEMCVLYNHQPLVTLLACDIVRYKIDEKSNSVTVMGGFAEITEEQVVILTDASELSNTIDLERAMQAKQRAEGRLLKSEFDQKRAEIALKKAITRINVKQEK